MKKTTLGGDLDFQMADALMSRFKMVPTASKKGMLKSNVRLDLSNEVLPDDFDIEKHEVTGTFEFKIEVKERKK